MDDEPQLLHLLEKHLRRLGFEVESQSTALSALSALEASPGRFELVVADLGLPDMPGDKLVARLFALQPTLQVLLCSGSEFFVSTLPAEWQPRVGFLQKPFGPKQLSEKIHQMLAR